MWLDCCLLASTTPVIPSEARKESLRCLWRGSKRGEIPRFARNDRSARDEINCPKYTEIWVYRIVTNTCNYGALLMTKWLQTREAADVKNYKWLAINLLVEESVPLMMIEPAVCLAALVQAELQAILSGTYRFSWVAEK
jgi:hypothetical protein